MLLINIWPILDFFLQLSNSDGAGCLPIWSKTNSNEQYLQKITLLSKFNRSIQVWAWRHFGWSRLCPNGWTALFHGLVVCPVEHSGILDAYKNICSFMMKANSFIAWLWKRSHQSAFYGSMWNYSINSGIGQATLSPLVCKSRKWIIHTC